MDWSIQHVAQLAGTTSRTLRHYDGVGILAPSRVGANGYRYYDQAALVKLQRILLLRKLGLGLPAIADLLAGDSSDSAALQTHLEWLRTERHRLDRQIASVQRTITRLRDGEDLMAEDMFDGFDHAQYKDEVESRWGPQAYADSHDWWSSLSGQERQEFTGLSARLAADWLAAYEAGLDPASERVQAIARRHHHWVGVGWGGKPVPGAALVGLAQMYVDDERFGRHYGGRDGASYVRDALTVYAGLHL